MKTLSKLSNDTAKFYGSLKTKAADLESFAGVPKSKMKVIGNSADYPDTISITTDDLANYDGIIAVQYDSSNKVVDTYAITTMELMPIMDKFAKDNTLVCRHSAGNDQLTRIAFKCLEEYKMKK